MADTPRRLPFNRPTTSERGAAYVEEAMDTGLVAGPGPFGHRCETELQRLTDAGQVLLTSSCTHALEMSALLLEPRPGDEVLVPSFAFVSTVNAFVMHGFTPVFVDCDPDTLNLDPDALPRLISPRTRAVVALHYAGVACDMDRIGSFAREHGLAVIEDAAHGLFGRYRGAPLGSFGTCAALSFHETKNVMCGQGGALLVNEPALVARAEVLRDRGTDRSRFSRGEVGKYHWTDLGSPWHLSELHAALLWSQLEDRDRIQVARRRVWDRYHAELRGWAMCQGVRRPVVPEHCEHPSHLYYLLLPDEDARDRFIAHLADSNIQAVFHYQPLHRAPFAARVTEAASDCPVADAVSGRLVRLPLYTALEDVDQARIIDTIRRFNV